MEKVTTREFYAKLLDKNQIPILEIWEIFSFSYFWQLNFQFPELVALLEI